MAADEEFEMLMPFVVVSSVGGPFDDGAYTAGWEMGALDARLAAAKHHALGCPTVVLRRENVPQAELVAMKHGMVLAEIESVPSDEISDAHFEAAVREWAHVRFDWGTPCG